MSVLELSDLLRQLIMEHNSVSLPGMGSFTIVETPSELLNEGRMITPPLKKIVFDSSDSSHGNLLVSQYAKLKHISEKESDREVSDLLRQMKKELVDNAEVVIDNFGTLYFASSGNFVFEALPEFDFEADSYCLETLLLQKRSEIGDIEVVEADILEEIQQNLETDKIEPEAEEKAEQPKNRGTKVLIWIGVVIGLFVILIIAVLLFKDSLMPMLEQLLYSEEELEILKLNKPSL